MLMMRLALPVAILLLSSALSAPSAAAAPYAERVRQMVLDNGLEVLVLEDHKAPVGVLQVWYRTGSRNETVGRTGLSHLLEHMMYKGTEKVGPDEYSRIIRRNGGNDNAFTSQDYTVYFVTLASDRLSLVVDLEADRMANLVLRNDLYEPERDVVAEERRLRTDDRPTGELFELINATAYTAHPYEWPVIGWMNDIQKSARDDLETYYRTYYRPNNAFVIAVGDIDGDAFFAAVKKAFGALPKQPPPPEVRSMEPPQRGERRAVLERQAELPFVATAYHVPNALHPDSAALNVLSALLSDGKSSRLYDELVYKQRVALSVGASYDDTSKDPGLFTIYGQPLPGSDVGALEGKLLAQVKRLASDDVSAAELEKVKNGLEADFILAQDSLFYQGLLLGQYEILGDWRLLDEYVPHLRAVTAADVKRVASAYLTAENRTVGVLVPEPNGKRTSHSPPASGGPLH